MRAERKEQKKGFFKRLLGRLKDIPLSLEVGSGNAEGNTAYVSIPFSSGSLFRVGCKDMVPTIMMKFQSPSHRGYSFESYHFQPCRSGALRGVFSIARFLTYFEVGKTFPKSLKPPSLLEE